MSIQNVRQAISTAMKDGSIRFQEAEGIQAAAGKNPTWKVAREVEKVVDHGVGLASKEMLEQVVQNGFDDHFAKAHRSWFHKAEGRPLAIEVDVSDVPDDLRQKAETVALMPAEVRYVKIVGYEGNERSTLGWGASFDDDSDARTLIAQTDSHHIPVQTRPIVYE